MIQRFWLWCRNGSAEQATQAMILAAMLVFMTACSTSGHPPASSSSSPGPAHSPAPALTNLTACMLITAKEMQQIIGGLLFPTETTVNAAIGQTQCEYDSAAGSAYGVTAFVALTTCDRGKLWATLLSRATRMPAAYQTISGLGDGALFQREDTLSPSHVLWMRKGSLVVQTWLQADWSGEPRPLSAQQALSSERQVMQVALKRLEGLPGSSA